MTKNNGEKLAALRSRLSEVDESLLALFSRRMDVVRGVAEYKYGVGAPVRDGKREGEILEGLTGPERALVRTLMRLSRGLQYELLLDRNDQWELGKMLKQAYCSTPTVRTAVYAGSARSPSAAAAARLFPAAKITSAADPASAIAEVAAQRADVAVLPFVNGAVAKDLYIRAAVEQPGGTAPRIAALGRTPILLPQANRVSLLLPTSGETNALAEALNIFSDLEINLAKAEAHNRLGPFVYLEFLAAPLERNAMLALYQLEQEFPQCRFCGWYALDKC